MLRFGTDGVRGDADADLTDAADRRARSGRGAGARRRHVSHRARHARVGAAHRGGSRSRARGRGCAVVLSLGVAPTPAIAFLAQRDGAPAAIVSASHNPWNDNGVKLIGADGRKLADEVEAAIEAELRALISTRPRPASRVTARRPTSVTPVGGRSSTRTSRTSSARSTGGRSTRLRRRGRLRERRRVGARAARVARRAAREVDVLHAAPDGRNINDGCGSTHPEELRGAVVEHGARPRARARRRRRPGGRGRRAGRARRRRPDHGDDRARLARARACCATTRSR